MKSQTFALIAPLLLALLSGCASTPREINIEPDVIESSLQEHRKDFVECYRHELDQGHSGGGKIVASFTIESQGDVQQAEAKEVTLKNPSLETCVLDVIRQIRFPAPKTGSLRVTYPFNFHAG